MAPTNSQLSLKPRESMLLLPSSVISRLASLSNLSKPVGQAHPFSVLNRGGRGDVLGCRFVKRRDQHDGSFLDAAQETDERFHLCRESKSKSSRLLRHAAEAANTYRRRTCQSGWCPSLFLFYLLKTFQSRTIQPRGLNTPQNYPQPSGVRPAAVG